MSVTNRPDNRKPLNTVFELVLPVRFSVRNAFDVTHTGSALKLFTVLFRTTGDSADSRYVHTSMPHDSDAFTALFDTVVDDKYPS
jgi:hypothetical protein